jgi:hypothetical protein
MSRLGLAGPAAAVGEIVAGRRPGCKLPASHTDQLATCRQNKLIHYSAENKQMKPYIFLSLPVNVFFLLKF